MEAIMALKPSPRYPIIAWGNYLNTMNIGTEIVSKFLVVLGFLTASFFLLFFLYVSKIS